MKGNKGTLEMGSALKFEFNNVKKPKERKKNSLISFITGYYIHH